MHNIVILVSGSGSNMQALVEAGSGKVLSGLVKRIDKDLSNITLDTPADLEAFGKVL